MATTPANLSNACIDIESLKEHASNEILQLLECDPSVTKKAMVLDPSLSGPIGSVVSVKQFRAAGIQQFSLLNSPSLNTGTCEAVFYFLRPNPSLVQLFIQHVKARQRDPRQASVPVKVHFVPRRSLMCEKLMAQAGIMPYITVGEYALDVIPLEHDVLSLEIPHAFHDLSVEGSGVSATACAHALVRLQAAFGTIPVVKGKGNAALKVFQIAHRLRTAGDNSLTNSNSLASITSTNGNGSDDVSLGLQNPWSSNLRVPDISMAVIIDRSVDIITPVLTPNTYEGVIDEFIGIKNGAVEVAQDAVDQEKAAEKKNAAPGSINPTPAAPEMKRVLLNSSDRLFEEVRDVPFYAVGPSLHRKTEFIKATYSERHNAQSLHEMHQFLNKFKTVHQEHTLLMVHVNIADKVGKELHSSAVARRTAIEMQMLLEESQAISETSVSTAIYKNEPLNIVLRQLCLLSFTVGLSKKAYQQFRTEIIQRYGFEHLTTLANLEKIGVLNRSVPRPDWALLRNKLKLTLTEPQREALVKTINGKGPTGAVGGIAAASDYHYVYKGYAPLSVRLVENAVTPAGWSSIDTCVATLPGPHFEYRQELPIEVQERMSMPVGYSSALPAVYAFPEPSQKQIRALLPQKDWKFIAPTSANNSLNNVAKATGGSVGVLEHKKPVVLVFFVGGCTYGEISALRHLSQLSSHDRSYLILTTKIINGNSFVDSIIDPMENLLDQSVM